MFSGVELGWSVFLLYCSYIKFTNCSQMSVDTWFFKIGQRLCKRYASFHSHQRDNPRPLSFVMSWFFLTRQVFSRWLETIKYWLHSVTFWSDLVWRAVCTSSSTDSLQGHLVSQITFPVFQLERQMTAIIRGKINGDSNCLNAYK